MLSKPVQNKNLGSLSILSIEAVLKYDKYCKTLSVANSVRYSVLFKGLYKEKLSVSSISAVTSVLSLKVDETMFFIPVTIFSLLATVFVNRQMIIVGY